MTELRTRALLFDLDGVLVDSIQGVEHAWRTWAVRNSLNAEDVVRAVHGRRAVDTVALVAPHLNLEHELLALTDAEASDAIGLYPITGVAALLQLLPRNRWAVVTSGMRRVAEFRLQIGGIAPPDVLVSAEDVSRGKPDPEGYLKAAKALGFAPDDCIVVEDAAAGIQAAIAAGMRTLGVLGTYSREALGNATAIVESFGVVSVRVDGDEIVLSLP